MQQREKRPFPFQEEELQRRGQVKEQGQDNQGRRALVSSLK